MMFTYSSDDKLIPEFIAIYKTKIVIIFRKNKQN